MRACNKNMQELINKVGELRKEKSKIEKLLRLETEKLKQVIAESTSSDIQFCSVRCKRCDGTGEEANKEPCRLCGGELENFVQCTITDLYNVTVSEHCKMKANESVALKILTLEEFELIFSYAIYKRIHIKQLESTDDDE